MRDKIIITYSNGITQEYYVISHQNEYLAIIKPSKLRLYEIDGFNKNQKKKYEEEVRILNTLLSDFKFKWCTDESPIYLSHKTQILSLHENQGKDIKVKTTLIKGL